MNPMGALTQPTDTQHAQPERHPAASGRKRALRAIAAIAIALAGIFVFSMAMHPSGTDFVEYWSSAKLLLNHADPYSPASVFALEKARGFLPQSPLIMLNPPWALFLIAPLGLAGIQIGFFLWTIAAIGCVLVFIKLLNKPSANNLLALAFAPVLACLCSGQSSPFLLLGFCLFLYFHKRRPLLAGAALLLMALKPHLFLVFWVVLFAECIQKRKFLIPIGFLSAVALASIFPLCFDLQVWWHYIETVHSASLKQAVFPTLSMVFRQIIDPGAVWLLFVPSIAAVLWGLWYYRRNRKDWDWKAHGMLLMLVTVLASPYGFFTDQIVLLPSIAFALTFPKRREYSGPLLLVINCIAIVPLIMPHASLTSLALVWTPAAWLTWFLYATYRPQNRNSPACPANKADAQFSATRNLLRETQ